MRKSAWSRSCFNRWIRKMNNWALKIEDEEEFVKLLLTGQPEPPKYFAMMKK